MPYKTVTKEGRKYVLVPADDFAAMRGDRQPALPPLPKPDADGNVPAVAFARAAIIRGLIQDMKTAGLTQTRLAELSGLRIETINRTLNGKTVPDTATLAKLNVAIGLATRTSGGNPLSKSPKMASRKLRSRVQKRSHIKSGR